MVGADLANLANEAALLAARRDNHDKVQMADFTESLEKILLGAPRGIVLSPEDRERTAYHESGHALVGMLTPGGRPGPQGLDHPARDGARASRSRPPTPTASPTRRRTSRRRSRSRSAAAQPRRSCTGRSPPEPSRTSSSSPRSPARWSGRWGMSDKVGPVTVLPIGRRGPVPPRRQRDLAGDAVAGRSGGAPDRRRRSTRRSPSCSPSTATSSTRLAHALLKAETLDAPDAYAAAGVPMRAAELTPEAEAPAGRA